MLAVVVPWHEPWSDEAQAWLLARDLSIPQLLFHYLRYESHPALWYLILWVPSHLHLNYAVLGWISAAIASAGIYVLLRLSPFPYYLRAILPFTFFLAYQFAVVARSYVLFPPLCFLIAHVYRQTRPRPVLMAVLLALLANVSVHGTLVACTLAPIYSWNLFHERRSAALSRRTLTWAAILFLASIVLVAVTIYPPADLHTIASPTVSRAIGLLAIQHQTASSSPYSSPAPQVIQTFNTAGDALPLPVLKDRVFARWSALLRVLSYPVSTSHVLSCVLYLLTVFYLYSRKALVLLAPLAVLTLFLVFVYAREWHLGLLWIVLLMVLWAAWDAEADLRRPSTQNAIAGLLVLVSLLQIPWTWNAVRYDIHAQYYPSTQAASYLHSLPPGLRIAGFGDANTILPYFSKNIFFNRATTFNWNGPHTGKFADLPNPMSMHPDLVIVWAGDTASLDLAQSSGYRETHRFCGRMFLPYMETKEVCYIFLEPSGRPASLLPRSVPGAGIRASDGPRPAVRGWGGPRRVRGKRKRANSFDLEPGIA